MLNPKITKFPTTQITADKNPAAVPMSIEAKAHRFSFKKFTTDSNNPIPS
jgi:hypothetical protein